MAKKKNKKKSYFTASDIQGASKVDRRTEEEKKRDFNIVNFMRWHRVAIILAIIGVLAALLGQVREWKAVQYSGIFFWMGAVLCYSRYAQKRNEYIIEQELKRKEEREKEKSDVEK